MGKYDHYTPEETRMMVGLLEKKKYFTKTGRLRTKRAYVDASRALATDKTLNSFAWKLNDLRRTNGCSVPRIGTKHAKHDVVSRVMEWKKDSETLAKIREILS